MHTLMVLLSGTPCYPEILSSYGSYILEFEALQQLSSYYSNPLKVSPKPYILNPKP